MTDFLKIDRDGHVVTLTLNRPEKRNALAMPHWQALGAAIRGFAGDEAVRAVVLRRADAGALAAAAMQAGMPSLRETGLRKALAGETSVEEYVRLFGMSEPPALADD